MTPTATILDPRLAAQLRAAIDQDMAAGHLLTSEQISQQIGTFRDRFGLAVLQRTNGEALLRLLHSREDAVSRCMAYWLEFKNDEEFAGDRFGGIGGGSALKFGIFQRQIDNAWMTGSPMAQKELSLADAIELVQRQRDELLAGSEVLGSLNSSDFSDEAYSKLQAAMEAAAPNLARFSWAHKYWFLTHHAQLDDYHSPSYQRFHLLKLLQMPPDEVGILDSAAQRFNCAGRFVDIARQLSVPVTRLTSVLTRRDGAFHRYWRVGTTDGDGKSQWEHMREGGFVSIGWSQHVSDLTDLLGSPTAKEDIRKMLLPAYRENAGVAKAKAGEILNFAQIVAENDLVLACDGQKVLGVGRVTGSYEFDQNLWFPHKRPVQWLMIDSWILPEAEGLLRTVYELGRSASNLLELERRLFYRTPLPARRPVPALQLIAVQSTLAPLPALDAFAARLDQGLRRKGQMILSGPPGTGKTYQALRVAKELAWRQAFGKSFSALSKVEQMEAAGTISDLVRVCTFHPGYSYEDFIEGLRPKTLNGQLVFEPQDGIFKQLCADAAKRPEHNFYLIIDEINRGDIARIFGELITGIEFDKRGQPIILPVTRQQFTIPRNVFLLATMNSADRSISLMDFALRRRFLFVEMVPDATVLDGRKAGALPLGPWLEALNRRVAGSLKRDARSLQIGHAYLMPQPAITSVADFARVLRDEIIPLLKEYCYEDGQTLRQILGDSMIDAETGCVKEELFEPHQEAELLRAVWFHEVQVAVLSTPLASAQLENGDVEPEEDIEGERKEDAASVTG